jgi:hypothetical protein
MDCTHYINLPNQPQLHQPHQLLLPASASLNLTTLNLAGCTQVSNNELRVLATLTALTSLNLGYCSDNGSDNRLRTTWSGRTTGSTQVSDNGLRALAGLTALTSLNLEACRQVSDDGLLALSSLTALTSLNLKACRQVSDGGLRALTASLTALTSLDLSHLDYLTNYGLHGLASLTALTSLNLRILLSCGERRDVRTSSLHCPHQAQLG